MSDERKSRTYLGRERPASGRELYSWFFIRVSGLLLVFLALFHLLYQHVVVGVDALTFDTVAARLQEPQWKLFYSLLLGLALFHGANGAQNVITDHIHRRGTRLFVVTAVWVVVLVVTIAGVLVLTTFTPGG